MSTATPTTQSQDDEVQRLAERLGIDLDAGRRNGDRISLATLELLVSLDERFTEHQLREEQLYGSFILMGLGAACTMAPSIVHSVSQALTFISGRDVTIDVSLPLDFLETIGGMLLLVGAMLAVSPKLCATLIGRAFMRIGR